VVTNVDKPGVIGVIGTTLGNAGVNIAGVHLSVAGAGAGGAASVWTLDSAIPADVLAELRLSPNVSSAIPIRV
jgi:D-3-phosphoglycerate dehydrogenase / 2-oxoglutarate reductase